jgi:predicted nucleotidyltransferase
MLAEFLSQMWERCGDHIAHVWLFGSKVRGDFDEESDMVDVQTGEGDSATLTFLSQMV